MDMNHYDTALPPITFHHTPLAHRRTGSTLKTVMRRIFNRKRQSQADGVEESPHEAYYSSSPPRQSGQIVGKSFLAVPTPSESKRNSPLSEENLQIAETHLSPNSLSPGSPGFPGMPQRRRRATLPSVVFSDDESRCGVASSAISDPQEDRPFMTEQQRRRSMLQARRRSKSIDALCDLAGEPPMSPPLWSTRAASILNSAPDSRSAPLEGSSASDLSRRPSSGTTVTSETRASAVPSIPESDQHAEQMSLPPNVGNLVRCMQQDDSLTVEQRLNTLEVKMIDLEFAIARMQSNSMELQPSSRPKQTPSTDSFTNVRSKPPGLSTTMEREESPNPLPNLSERPTSTSTIRPDTMNSRLRPAPSATSLSDFTAVSIEQYSALVTLLRREQTARRNLESQVSSLRDDIRRIQRAALQSMEMGSMYPIQTVNSQEFLRFRRALDDSDSSSPIRTPDGKNGNQDSSPDWSPPESYDPFGPPKWEQGKRIVTAPMI